MSTGTIYRRFSSVPVTDPNRLKPNLPREIQKLVGAWEDARDARNPDEAAKAARDLQNKGYGNLTA